MSEEECKPFGGWTDEEVEALVERVSERVINNFYTEVGKNVVRKFLWLAGLIAVGLAAMFGLNGKIPAP